MNMRVSISIITITYNNYSELMSTLSSIEAIDCEKIVVNGGSCPKTKEFLDAQKNIIYLSEPDRGISDAFNKGIKLSTQEGIWFINSGDHCIDHAYADYAQKHITKYDFIYANVLYDSVLYGKLKIAPREHGILGLGMPYPHPGMIFNRSVFDRIGLFNLDYKIAMDFELVCRMKKANMSGHYYPHNVVHMDGTGISSTQHSKAFKEDGLALSENNLMSSMNYFAYKARGLKLKTLLFGESVGLLKYYRNIKKLIKS